MSLKILGTSANLGSASNVDNATVVAVSVTTAGIVEHRETNGTSVIGTIFLPVGVHVLYKKSTETIANAASSGAVATVSKIAYTNQ